MLHYVHHLVDSCLPFGAELVAFLSASFLSDSSSGKSGKTELKQPQTLKSPAQIKETKWGLSLRAAPLTLHSHLIYGQYENHN